MKPSLPPKKLVNPEHPALTTQKYKELSGLLHLNDEEAEATVHSIHQLAKILYRFAALKKAS